MAEHVPSAARWQLRYTHMLGPECNEVIHGRVIVQLLVCTKELAAYNGILSPVATHFRQGLTLGKANSVEAALELSYI